MIVEVWRKWARKWLLSTSVNKWVYGVLVPFLCRKVANNEAEPRQTTASNQDTNWTRMFERLKAKALLSSYYVMLKTLDIAGNYLSVK